MTPLVSVIIATYNYGHYLAGALDSVLAQTFTDWEAIVVDDGSTDDTPGVVQPYLTDPRIRYHRTANRGQPAAENTGIRQSRGAFVAFLDADDSWLPRKLDLQINLFRANPCVGIVYSRRRVVGPDGQTLQSDKRVCHRGTILPHIFRNNFVCFSSSVVARRVFDKTGLFNEEYRHASDYDLWLRAAQYFSFDFVDEPLLLYRTGHANLTSRADVQLATALKIMDRFLAEHPNCLGKRLVRRCYAETYLHMGQAEARRSRVAAFPWYVWALAKCPGYVDPWKELVKILLPQAVLTWTRHALGPLNDRPPFPKTPRSDFIPDEHH